MRTRSILAALALAGALTAQPQLLIPLTPPTPQNNGGGGGGMRARIARAEVTPAQNAAREFQRARVSGRQLARAITKVNKELAWHDDLGDASQAALKAGKPIVWFQVLGSRKGYT